MEKVQRITIGATALCLLKKRDSVRQALGILQRELGNAHQFVAAQKARVTLDEEADVCIAHLVRRRHGEFRRQALARPDSDASPRSGRVRDACPIPGEVNEAEERAE